MRAVCSIRAKEARPANWYGSKNRMERHRVALNVLGSFSSSDSTGETMDEMRRNFHAQRSKEFASHDCAKYPRSKGAKASS